MKKYILVLLLCGCATDSSLSDINLAVNRDVQYVADVPHADHWQTPQETAQRGAGDCEDFAIMKMSELPAGYAGNLVVVLDLATNQYHTILRATNRSTGAVYYLDNRRQDLVQANMFSLYYRPIKVLAEGKITKKDFVYGAAAQ